MSLARQLRKLADRLETPRDALARRMRVPLHICRAFNRVKAQTEIRTVFDVGANVGEFSRWAAGSFPDATIHAFEPLEECQRSLQELAASHPAVRVHRCALGSTHATVEMFQNDYGPSSSLLPMLSRHSQLWPKTEHATKVAVTLETLDDVMSRGGFQPPALLKLDVQGFELQVLKGAESTLLGTAAVMTEVLFDDLYAGQADFRGLLDSLADHNFRFLEFVDERRLPPSGEMIYADALFVKRTPTVR